MARRGDRGRARAGRRAARCGGRGGRSRRHRADREPGARAPRRTRPDRPIGVRRPPALETPLAVAVEPGPPLTIDADADQLDQLLINLVRNAADASPEHVSIGWRATDGSVVVTVADEGPGVADTANLFVPFF